MSTIIFEEGPPRTGSTSHNGARDEEFEKKEAIIHSGPDSELPEKKTPVWRRFLGDGNKDTQKTLKPRHISFLALGRLLR